MRKQKRKFNRVRVIAIIALIISLFMALGSVVIVKLQIVSPLLACIMLFIGLVGTPISTYVIVVPDTKNNDISKAILNHFDATKD